MLPCALIESKWTKILQGNVIISVDTYIFKISADNKFVNWFFDVRLIIAISGMNNIINWNIFQEFYENHDHTAEAHLYCVRLFLCMTTCRYTIILYSDRLFPWFLEEKNFLYIFPDVQWIFCTSFVWWMLVIYDLSSLTNC